MTHRCRNIIDEGVAQARACRSGFSAPEIHYPSTVPPSLDPMHQQVIAFWFHELQPAQWWRVDPALDAAIRDRFGRTLESAKACELYPWRASPEGRLAEVIVLDQFSRNIHQGTPAAFAADPLALALAQEAVSLGADQALPLHHRAFLYMPYMHSESVVIHGLAEQLFTASGLTDNLKAELRHKDIIARFGRYPHRNAILGRPSTPQEEAFLKEPGSSF
jgi:uncharacterized protein (DUF924 family)